MDATLKQAIADELQVDPSVLTRDAVLIEIENWSSVTALSIMVLLSDALPDPVSPETMVRLKIFGDIEDLLVKGASN